MEEILSGFLASDIWRNYWKTTIAQTNNSVNKSPLLRYRYIDGLGTFKRMVPMAVP